MADAPNTADLARFRRETQRRKAEIERRDVEYAEDYQRRVRLRESFNSVDWVGPYFDELKAAGDGWFPIGPTGRTTRQRGSNWPIYNNEQQLALLRQPSRMLLGTNPYAIGLRAGLTSYVLGTGATYRVQRRKGYTETQIPTVVIDVVQKIVDDFLEVNEWAGGEQQPIEQEFFERSLEDGETLLVSFPDDDGPETLVRFADAEQLTETGCEAGIRELFPDRDETPATLNSYGVITSATDVARIYGYHLVYGDAADDHRWLGPDRVLHLKRNVRRNQKRGVPDFAFGLLDSLDQAHQLRGAMAAGAIEQAAIASVMRHETGTPGQIEAIALEGSTSRRDSDGRSRSYRKAIRGENRHVGIGSQFVEGPAASNALPHLSILSGCLRAGAVRWNAPEWLVSADASNTNYASSLTAESPFVIRIRREQKQYSAAFRRVVLGAVKHSLTTRPLTVGQTAVTWEMVVRCLDLVVTLPDPVVRNPLEQAQVAQVEIPLGVQSPQGYCDQVGRDYQQVQQEIDEHLAATGGPGGSLDSGHEDQNLPDDILNTVGGAGAILNLQKEYASGVINREMAITNATTIYGVPLEKVNKLFPVNVQKKAIVEEPLP